MPENNTPDNRPLGIHEINGCSLPYFDLVEEVELLRARLQERERKKQEIAEHMAKRVEASPPPKNTEHLVVPILQNSVTSVEELKQAEQQVQELKRQVTASRGETAVWLSSEQAGQKLQTTSRRSEQWTDRERNLHLYFGVLATDASLKVRPSGQLAVPMKRVARAKVLGYGAMLIDEHKPLSGLVTKRVLEEVVPDSGPPEMALPRLGVLKNIVVIIGNQAVDTAIEQVGNAVYRQTLTGFKDEINRPRE